jgi:hypothetical protein
MKPVLDSSTELFEGDQVVREGKGVEFALDVIACDAHFELCHLKTVYSFVGHANGHEPCGENSASLAHCRTGWDSHNPMNPNCYKMEHEDSKSRSVQFV